MQWANNFQLPAHFRSASAGKSHLPVDYTFSVVACIWGQSKAGQRALLTPELAASWASVCVCVCVCVCMLSCVWFFATPWTEARQAPLSMRFPSKNTSRLPVGPGLCQPWTTITLLPLLSNGSFSCPLQGWPLIKPCTQNSISVFLQSTQPITVGFVV